MDSVKIRASIVRSLISLVGKLPLKILYGLGGAVAWVMRSVLDYRKNVIYTNIARTFPWQPYEWIDHQSDSFHKLDPHEL